MSDQTKDIEKSVEATPATNKKDLQKYIVIFSSIIIFYVIYEMFIARQNVENAKTEEVKQIPQRPRINDNKKINPNLDRINKLKGTIKEKAKQIAENLTTKEKYEILFQDEMEKFYYEQHLASIQSYSDKTLGYATGGNKSGSKNKSSNSPMGLPTDEMGRVDPDEYVAAVLKKAKKDSNQARYSFQQQNGLGGQNSNGNSQNNNQGSGSSNKRVIIDAFNGNPNNPLMPAATVMNISLQQEINSDFQGGFRGILNNDVYSVNKTDIVIPRGVEVLGHAKKYSGVNEIIQASQLLVVEWVVLPDGSMIRLSGIGDALDKEGQAGIPGDVNYHFGWKLFGAGATALIGSFGSYDGSGDNSNKSFEGEMSSNVRDLASNQAGGYMNLRPTVIAEFGQVIKFQTNTGVHLPSWGNVYDY